MTTAVYQSFRTENVPGWIQACLQSVRDWAAKRGFEYRFWDDRFFDLVPPALRPRASQHVCLLTDYARLVAARRLLDEGFDRVVWVDADAVVFDPDHLELPLTSGFCFCREVWHDLTLFGRPFFRLTVNNSFAAFCRDEQILGPYLREAGDILAGNAPLSAVSIGTEWLHRRRQHEAFPLINQIGIFGPEMMYRYLNDDARFLRPYLRFQTGPISAVNLCHSKLGTAHRFAGATEAWRLDDRTLLRLIERLQADRGASLNRHFDRPYSAPRDEFSRPLSRLQDFVRRVQRFAASRLSLRLGRSTTCPS